MRSPTHEVAVWDLLEGDGGPEIEGGEVHAGIHGVIAVVLLGEWRRSRMRVKGKRETQRGRVGMEK